MAWFAAGVLISLIAFTGYACVRVGADYEDKEKANGMASAEWLQ